MYYIENYCIAVKNFYVAWKMAWHTFTDTLIKLCLVQVHIEMPIAVNLRITSLMIDDNNNS